MDCVQECAELSMQKAVDSAKSTSDYPTNGEVYLLLLHTVYVYCWCEYIYISGLNITEVAHDYCTSVSNYIINDLHLLNSYDTWHGMSSSYMYPIVVRTALVTCEGTKNHHLLHFPNHHLLHFPNHHHPKLQLLHLLNYFPIHHQLLLLYYLQNIIHDVNMNDQNSFISLIPTKHLLFTEETKSTSCSSQRALNLTMKSGEGCPLLKITCIYVFLCTVSFDIVIVQS